MGASSGTVLITGAGTVTCQSVIKGLRGQDEIDVTIVTVDAAGNVAGRYFSDAFYQVPRADDPDFVPALLSICRAHDVDLLVPIVDYEFEPLARAAPLFADEGCLVAISPVTTIRLTNDKRATYHFFRQHGFGTAMTWSAEEARAQASTLAYPLFLKPAIDGRSSLDCHRIENAGDLHLYLDQIPGAMVQEFIDGREYTADVLADLNSEVLGVVVRERIETKGGVSYKGVTVADDELVDEVVRMVRLLGAIGPLNIQAFRREGQLLFNEINPRFSGALALSLAAGFNSPVLLLEIALGLPPPSLLGRTRIGITMLRYWDEVFVDPLGSAEYPEYRLAPTSRRARVGQAT